MIKVFNQALKNHFAIGQFNISTNEQLRGVIQAGIKLKSPLIIGASENERNFFGDQQLVATIEVWKKNTGLPIILNADHCQTYESAKKAANAGFTAIHIDGSKLSFNKNIELTSKTVRYIRKKDKKIIIEGELGYLRGGSNIHTHKTKILSDDLTKPEEAKEFYRKTKIDNLAIVIGNIHGIESNMKNPSLHIDRLQEIVKTIPQGRFVLHGGSGTPISDIKKAIKYNIVKININTELRLAFSNSLRNNLKENPKEVKPYNILNPIIKSTEMIVSKKIKLFKSLNRI